MFRAYCKERNKPNVPEAVIQQAVRALQERRLSLRVAASRNEITPTALNYRFKKSAVVTSAIGPTFLLRVKQVGKFSLKTRI